MTVIATATEATEEEAGTIIVIAVMTEDVTAMTEMTVDRQETASATIAAKKVTGLATVEIRKKTVVLVCAIVVEKVVTSPVTVVNLIPEAAERTRVILLLVALLVVGTVVGTVAETVAETETEVETVAETETDPEMVVETETAAEVAAVIKDKWLIQLSRGQPFNILVAFLRS
eukprot:GILK01005847.1.p3 GENE.GILK01005847.1~~GILK01005847.1.p3  ORF type:complete len:173 (+),score=20.34 GILK01005847.1:304-822(+)